MIDLPPLPQQRLMTDFAVDHPMAAILADPGLGKSRGCIDAVVKLFNDCGTTGVLIVSPLRVSRLTWPAELQKWSGLTFANLRTREGIEAWNRGSKDCYLINQEYLQQFTEQCLKGRRKIPVDMLVLDELGKYRSHNSKRAKALRDYRKHFRRFVGLTGTPSPNNYLDLYGQVRMLDGGERFGPSFHAFQNRYFESDFMGFKWTIRPGAKEAIEAKIADLALVMRSHDWMDIPPVTEEDIELTMPTPIMRSYREMEKHLLTQVKGTDVVAQSAGALVQKLMQFTSGAVYTVDERDNLRSVTPIHDLKVKALIAHHNSIGRRPLLVGTNFTHEVPRILSQIPWAREFDESKVDDWNAGKIPMWIAHPKAMAHGLNLQGTCHDVLWFSMSHSFDDYQQFNCRVARTGQARPTTITRLLMKDTIDYAIAEVVRNKERSQNILLHNLKLLAQTR